MSGPAVVGKLRSVMPVFLVDDVIASAEFYRDVLGFRISLLFPERNAELAIVDRPAGEGFHLAYGAGYPRRQNRPFDAEAQDAWIRVGDVEAVYDRVRKSGARITRSIETGTMGPEFEVEDLNGFVLGFGQSARNQISPRAYRVSPQFLVEDVRDAAEAYHKGLGFEAQAYRRRGGMETRLHRDDATIYLRASSTGHRGRSNRGDDHEVEFMWDAYVEVKGVRALRDEFYGRKAHLVRDLETTDYGTQEFEVEESSGYVLCFGEILTSPAA